MVGQNSISQDVAVGWLHRHGWQLLAVVIQILIVAAATASMFAI
jgi:hypothetical protein